MDPLASNHAVGGDYALTSNMAVEGADHCVVPPRTY